MGKKFSVGVTIKIRIVMLAKLLWLKINPYFILYTIIEK